MMVRIYFLLAIRNLLKNKLVSAINVVGLTVSVAFGLIAFLFIKNEWTYDRFHENVDRIYRVCVKSGDHVNGSPQEPFVSIFINSFPDFKVVRTHRSGRLMLYGEHSTIVLPRFVDRSFLDIFSFEMLMGNRKEALQDPNSIVITPEISDRFFPNVDPIGQIVSLSSFGNKEDYIVKGVVRVPSNSSIEFDCLIPFEAINNDRYSSHIHYDFSIFVLLPKHMQIQNIKDRLSELAVTLWGEDSPRQIYLQPLINIHFEGYISGVESTSDIIYSYILSGIALIVIIVGITNFVALTIGLSSTRAKEIGIRKLSGATKSQLVCQYLGEALLMTFIAVVLGIGLAELVIPSFNAIFQERLFLEYFSWTTIIAILVGTVCIGILSGIYPALVLSNFQPVEALNTRLKRLTPSVLIRGLMVFQFSASTVLMIATLTMMAQLNLFVNNNLGIRVQDIIVVNINELNKIHPNLVEVYRKKMKAYPYIRGVARSNHRLTDKNSLKGFFQIGDQTFKGLETVLVDYDFVKVLDLKLIEGRDFSENRSADLNNAMIVNEAFVKVAGWDYGAGKVVSDWNGNGPATVIGVVKDFHFSSLYNRVTPVALYLRPSLSDKLLVRSFVDKKADALVALQREWEKVAPSATFKASFLTEDIREQYKKDLRWLDITRWSAIIAVFLACLGAFGLTTYSIEQRSKEMGVHKILGASTSNLMIILSRDLLKLVLFANVIAWPIAYYFLEQWLHSFAYHIDLSITIFGLGSLLVVVMSLISISSQTYKMATADPISVLRND